MRTNYNVKFETTISFDLVEFDVVVTGRIYLEEPETNSPTTAEIYEVKDESGVDYLNRLSEETAKEIEEEAIEHWYMIQQMDEDYADDLAYEFSKYSS